jgi:hypothetical protein
MREILTDKIVALKYNRLKATPFQFNGARHPCGPGADYPHSHALLPQFV